ncbi:glutamine--fructose-6-phosphate transaminase (isomerizing) [Candidatus Parvarchaeota archaeon]|nr:glutamine--fructose-6-phosphate transaminase (isomerizing) [Candidatus Parvarchaeota archaeon]
MCGIIAYNGQKDAIPYLIDGIRNLEYRGYDSFGCAVDTDDGIIVKKDIGRIDDVVEKYKINAMSAKRAIFHTRWATHGSVTKDNAHPMVDCAGKVAVVHNGIIENWEELKSELGTHKFVSDTDTEVLAHLVEERMKTGDSLDSAVRYTFGRIKGSSSFVVLNKGNDEMVAVKKGSPLVLGLAKSGTFVSSDVPSFIKHTNKVIYLNDGDMVRISKNKYEITNLIDKNIRHKINTVNLAVKDLGKGEHEHFMLKEIMEQQELLKNLESTDLSATQKAAALIKKARTIYLVGAGTSFHVARLGARLMRDNGMNAVPVQGQDLPSYKKILSKKDVFVIISQSGETADIINSLSVMNGNKKIGIINVEGSKLAYESDILINVGAGPERAVASTKAFTLSAVHITLLALFAAGKKKEALRDLNLMNINMYNLLVPSVMEAIDRAAQRIKGLESIFFLGRDYDYILALEGALKLKEIAYIHAEAIDAATFKHGPLALVTNKTYAVVIVSEDTKKDIMNNLQEFKARKGKLVGIAESNAESFDLFIRMQSGGVFTFVMPTILLQLLAYKTSRQKNIDPDYPRSLAKSVTVL